MYYKWSLGTIRDLYPDLFDLMQVPPGIDRTILIETIIENYGMMGIAIPIVDMKKSIGRWSVRHQYEMIGLLESTQQVYNPVENYDRKEEITDETNAKTNSTQEGNSTANSKHKANGYNTAGDMDDMNADEGSQTTKGKGDTSTESTVTHTSHIHGNIGVTTAAQMLQGERDIHRFDVYAEIAKSFAMDLLVGLYY